jgi:Phospholipase_D-nuclease N-terminal
MLSFNRPASRLVRLTWRREDRNVLFSRRLHLPKLLHGRPHDIRLHHVVLAANFGCWRPISTPRYFGLGKAIWVIVLILVPYIGVFAYLISQGRSMAERNMQQAQQAREELRRVVALVPQVKSKSSTD